MTRIVDLDAWRRLCLDAYRNLSTDTTVTMGDVDAVLVAGARAAVLLDMSTTEGATAYDHLIDRVGRVTGAGRDDVDAILTWCAQGAVGLLSKGADITDPVTERMRQETGHDCIACPGDVRNMMATAHNLVVALDATRSGGDWPRVWRKAESMRDALAKLRPVSEAHFDALNAWRRP